MWEIVLGIAAIRVESMWQTISWIAAILSLSATYLNIKKRKSCFVVWTLTAIALVFVNICYTHDYAQATLFTGYAIFDIWGWFKWRRDERTKA
uniref:Putative nicotinamide mononucleotide transporter n=1 Tax=viral metagenome TaxID=1070528 RepID=A0A6M3KDC5_9ZZZZ